MVGYGLVGRFPSQRLEVLGKVEAIRAEMDQVPGTVAQVPGPKQTGHPRRRPAS